MTDTISHVAAGQQPVGPAIDEQRVAEQLAAQARANGIALAWLVYQRNGVTISVAKSVSRLEENAAAADVWLAGDGVTRLTAVVDRFRPGRHPREQARRAAMRATGRIRQLVGGGGGTPSK